jgi:hypothetical protein
MDWVFGSRDHGWLPVHDGLGTMERRGRSRAREVVVKARRERERRSSGFSLMTPLEGEAVEMAA